jgi:hypothetical protein
MQFMKIKYTLQGLLAAVIAVGIFLGSPILLGWLDPTAGTFDIGYLQRVAIAAVFFLFGTFLAWIALQIDWPDVNKYVDSDEKGFGDDFSQQSAKFKIITTMLLFFGLLAAFLISMALVPV